MPAIEERLIRYNRPGTPLHPRGVVVHSTDNPGATAEGHWRWWDTGDRKSSAHYVVDWVRIIRLIPESEVAWHAGPTANRMYLGVEMCEPAPGPKAAEQFGLVWANTVWLLADICRRHGWPAAPSYILSHADISRMYPGQTDHQDPVAYLRAYGKTMDDLRKEVERLMTAPAQPWQPKPTPVAILDAAGRRLCDGWLDGDRTVVRLRDLAEALGLVVSWDPGGPSVTLRWPGARPS